MRRNGLLFIILMLLLIRYSAAQNTAPVRIGLITEGLSTGEEKAVTSFLHYQKGIQAIPVSLSSLNDEGLHAAHITHIWWIKDSGEIGEREREAGTVLKKFVSSGGHLILSMEAVRLLNEWGIEKNRFEIRKDSVTDQGFGRPLGFHGYQDHPVYQGLHGGAYTWKGKEDHTIKKIGFFGKHLPDTSICHVIGIGWSYITFHEDQKLVLEYRIGKGSVISVGAYTYFSRPNFNQEELYRFYMNIFNYTAGKITGIKNGSWSYSPKQVLPVKKVMEKLSYVPATAWHLPPLSMQLERSKGGNNFVNLAGRRMLLMGREQEGIEEIWTHPFMAFKNIQTGIELSGKDSVIWLKNLVPAITVSPEMIIRKYGLEGDTLREMITVDLDKPIGVLHYEWAGSKIKQIWIKYTSNLRAMWPYSDTSSPEMNYQWSGGLNAAIISNPHAGSSSLMSFSYPPNRHLLGQFSDFKTSGENIGGIKTDLEQVSGCFSFNAAALKGKFNIYLEGGCEDVDAAIDMYSKNKYEWNTLYKKASAYYRKLLQEQLVITTPNQQLNEGYRWAMVRTDQFLQTTPGIGTSLMAGYATTASGWNGNQRVSGRPGYAWYFGRDGEWSAMALDAVGGFEKVKEVLKVFAKFQAINGKIFHELTSSGTVHYDASDATPLFVVLAAHYLHYSGDTSYLRKLWPAIKKAMDFCYSTDTDKDGLIENTNVGHGWLEGGPLFGSKTEVYLAGCWAAALDGADYIARHLHFETLQKQYASDSKKVKQIIDHDFWLPHEGYFANGKMPDNSFMKDQTILEAVPLLLNAVTDKKKGWLTAGGFSGNNFNTDWGIQTTPRNDAHYDPGDYQVGMVRPLFNGYASLAEYKVGHYVSGFTHLMNNLSGYNNWALGSIGETLNGETYRPNGICAQQAWCESMALQPAIEGMLAFKPDAISNRLSISPCFRWDWNDVKVQGMRIGNTFINMQFHHSKEQYTYNFEREGGAGISLDFNPVLPARTQPSKILVEGNEVHFSCKELNEGLQIILPEILLKRHLRISIFCKEGIGVLPLINQPRPNDRNVGAKIVAQHLEGNTYTIEVEGIPGKTYQIPVFSPRSPQGIENGTIQQSAETTYLITTTIPQTKSEYGSGKIIIHL